MNIRICLLENEEARRIITEFISNNQGCTAEDIVDGLKNHLSRVPLYNTLRELEAKEIIQDRSRNRRDHKYFIDTSNPTILIPQQLEKIVKSFRAWLNSSAVKWQNVNKSFNLAELR